MALIAALSGLTAETEPSLVLHNWERKWTKKEPLESWLGNRLSSSVEYIPQALKDHETEGVRLINKELRAFVRHARYLLLASQIDQWSSDRTLQRKHWSADISILLWIVNPIQNQAVEQNPLSPFFCA